MDNHEATNGNRPLSAEEMRERIERLKKEGRMPSFGAFAAGFQQAVQEVASQMNEDPVGDSSEDPQGSDKSRQYAADVDDGGDGIEFSAQSDDEAISRAEQWAIEWARQCDWDRGRDMSCDTIYLPLAVYTANEYTLIAEEFVAVHPPEPSCKDGHGHNWSPLPFTVPGSRDPFWCEGPTASRFVCSRCGKYQRIDQDDPDADLWDTGPSGPHPVSPGGLTRIRYFPADARSRDWVKRGRHAPRRRS